MDRPQRSKINPQVYPSNVPLTEHDSEDHLHGFSDQQHQSRTRRHSLNPAINSQSTDTSSESYSYPTHKKTSTQLDMHSCDLGANSTVLESLPSHTARRDRATSQGRILEGAWSNRRPTLVNDGYNPPTQSSLLKPPMGARTYSGAEEGRSEPEATPGTVISYLWNRGRGTTADIPADVTYPSDANDFDLFSPGNVVDHKGRGSYASRTYLDDKELLRRRPGLTARAGSEVGKALIKVSSVITAQERPPKREPVIVKNVRRMEQRREFILKLAKALLSYGAPSHRIESQLAMVSTILEARVSFVHIPSIIMVSLGDGGTKTMQTHFVRANSRIALSNLEQVHAITREVCRDKIACDTGTELLDNVLSAKALYPLYMRCFYCFICGSIICATAFGGSVIDMWISGTCAAFLGYLSLSPTTQQSSMIDNVYEISVSIFVSFIARALSTIKGDLFCYSAISSAGVVHILPGFTILVSALELTSRNIICGSVRMVYAVIYTLFLGFSLTIGSDLYLLVNPRARQEYLHPIPPKLSYFHGALTPMNGTSVGMAVTGTFGFANLTTDAMHHIYKGCFRDPEWPWWRHPFPWWTLLFLVPLYSTCSSLSNLQNWRSRELYIMVLFSCASYAANTASNLYLPDRGDIVSAVGALVIGSLGNAYSRIWGGTAFTSMVTGVMFLVPSGIAQAGGLSQTYQSSAAQYTSGFGLAVRMVEVAIGVTIGLFVSQIFVYTWGKKKDTAHFAF